MVGFPAKCNIMNGTQRQNGTTFAIQSTRGWIEFYDVTAAEQVNILPADQITNSTAVLLLPKRNNFRLTNTPGSTYNSERSGIFFQSRLWAQPMGKNACPWRGRVGLWFISVHQVTRFFCVFWIHQWWKHFCGGGGGSLFQPHWKQCGWRQMLEV